MPATILVVEDDTAIRRGVLDALKFAGHTTLEAGDGEKGMKLALTSTFDLMLLDLVLPHASGFDILKVYRQAAMERGPAGLDAVCCSRETHAQEKQCHRHIGALFSVCPSGGGAAAAARPRAGGQCG